MSTARKKWLEGRRTYIGGSDIAVICGLSNYRTPVELYFEKISTEPVKEEAMSEKAYCGVLLEPIVAKEYAKRTGNTIECHKKPIRHPKYPFLAANIDRWVNNRSFVFEAKTTGLEYAHEWGAQGSDDIPRNYYLQVAWYAHICDVPKVDIMVLIGGQEFRQYTYYRNNAFEEKLIKIGCNFWQNHIVPRIPPAPLNNRDLFLIYPNSKNASIEANDNIEQIAENLREIKSQQSKLEEERKQLSFEVQKYMKDHNTLLDSMGNPLITWHNTKKGNRTFLIK